MSELSALIRQLVDFAGWRAGLLVALMVAAAISEGLGLLLIVPLLAFTGSLGAAGPESHLLEMLTKFSTLVGMSLSFEIVLTGFVALIILRQTVIYWGARLAADTRIDFVANIRKTYFAALGETSWRFLNGGRLDQLGQILLIDSWRIGEVALHFIRILSGLVLLAANVVVAVIISPVLAASILGAIVVLTLLFSNRLSAVQNQGREIGEVQDNVYRVVENYLNNVRIAKVSGATERMHADFAATLDALSRRLSDFVADSESIKMTLQIVGAIAIALAVIIAVKVLGAGGPELLLLIFITARFIPRVSAINQDVHRLMHDLPAFARASKVLGEFQDHPDQETNSDPISAPRVSMGIRDVTVTADDEPGKILLDNVSLTISLHEMLAITGPSGAGKSTLVDVQAGLLKPDSGDIVLDGEPLDAASIGGWRRRVGYVSQTTTLLQDTIEHNLSWVLAEPANGADITQALRCAEIDKVIARLPNGLNTIVDRREGSLSGGERQRLAIARELLRRPDLLILDEATNALDVNTECLVLNNLRKYYPDLTILIVAHRPTAIDLADRVIELSNDDNARTV